MNDYQEKLQEEQTELGETGKKENERNIVLLLCQFRLIETTGGSLDLAAGKIGFETILQWIISHQK